MGHKILILIYFISILQLFGVIADKEECTSFGKSACGANGVCYLNNDEEHCRCISGYTGIVCNDNIDDCATNPCENGGTCNDMVNNYSCSCTADYEGTNCEKKIDLCKKNKAECVHGECEHGRCTCDQGYDGATCNQTIRTTATFDAGPVNVSLYELEHVVVLQCKLTHVSGNVRVAWMYEGGVIGMVTHDKSQIVKFSEGYKLEKSEDMEAFNLRIEKVEMKHMGWYTCQVCFEMCMGKETDNLKGKAYVTVQQCNEECVGCAGNETKCLECAQGYMHEKSLDRCEDIDECNLDHRVCGNYSNCYNTPGGYDCHCEEGYYRKKKTDKHCVAIKCKDGKCEGKRTCVEEKCVCPKDMERTSDGKCQGIEKQCKSKCGDNERCDKNKGNCVCKKDFHREDKDGDDKGKCVQTKAVESEELSESIPDGGVSVGSVIFYLVIVLAVLAIPCYLLYVYYDKISNYCVPEVKKVVRDIKGKKEKRERPKKPEEEGYGRLKNVEEALGSDNEEFSRSRKPRQQIY